MLRGSLFLLRQHSGDKTSGGIEELIAGSDDRRSGLPIRCGSSSGERLKTANGIEQCFWIQPIFGFSVLHSQLAPKPDNTGE